MAYGVGSQDAVILKAKEKKFETIFCFSIGKVYKPGAPQKAPYGHAVTRTEKLMRDFITNSRNDITHTFYYALTEGRPVSLIVDLDTMKCENPKKVEEFGHKLMEVLADFAGLAKDDKRRKMYAMTTRHRDGKASVHLIHRRIHFKDPRHQAAFMNKFRYSQNKKVKSIFKESVKLWGDNPVKNKQTIGIIDFMVYGSPTGDPSRKWNEDRRKIIYFNGEQHLENFSFWDVDPMKVNPDSQLVTMKGLSWGSSLKRKTFDVDEENNHKRINAGQDSLAIHDQIPACFKTDFLPIIEKELGGAGCAQIKGLKSCHSSRYEYFIDHCSKHQEASRCCKDPSKIHTSNRKKIFVNFETKEVQCYDKKSKTRITKKYPPGVYCECFKGCNKDHPKMVFNYKGPKHVAPPESTYNVTPISPLEEGDTAVQVEVPRFDGFGIELKGIGKITNLTPYLKHPYSANPIPKIKRNVESIEYFQAMHVPLETRCYLVDGL